MMYIWIRNKADYDKLTIILVEAGLTVTGIKEDNDCTRKHSAYPDKYGLRIEYGNKKE